MRTIISLTAAAFVAVSPALTARAQHAGNFGISANPVNNGAYFASGDATVSSDLGNRAVFVGKTDTASPATNFQTATPNPPITLTIAPGAKVDNTGAVYPDGGIYRSVSVFGGNRVVMNGGDVASAFVADTATFRLNGGNLFAGYTTSGTGRAEIAGGTVGRAFSYTNTAQTGGTIGELFAFGGVANVSGGTVSMYIDARNGSTVTVTGGTIASAFASDTSVLNIGGGTVMQALSNTVTNIYGGTVGYLQTNQVSTTNITGGSITAFNAIIDSVTNFRGGFLPDSRLQQSSVLNLFGGTITGTVFQLSNAATANFHGQAVAFSNAIAGAVPVQYGTGNGVYYDVAWTRADGSLLNTRYFDLDGNVDNATPQGTTFTQTVAVPEPGTFTLVAACFVAGASGGFGRKRTR